MIDQAPEEETYRQLEQKVKEYLEISGNCAQTSFLALQEQFGLDDGSILKALTVFPGIALRGETCGAVVGCLMALSLVYGRERLDDWDGYIRSLRPGRKFCRKFEKELGSTMCGDILESIFGKRYNLADPAEAEEWQKANAEGKCSTVVAAAVRIAAEIIIEGDQRS
jgi:C_GCAxxG_C_C family probable redox protein